MKGDILAVKSLLEQGSYVDMKDSIKRTLYMIVSAKRNIHAIKSFIECTGPSLVSGNKIGTLMSTFQKEDLEMVKLLLEYGADPNAGGLFNDTALMIASPRGHVDVVKLLLEYGAEINLVDTHGMGVLKYTYIEKNMSAMKLLILYGAQW